MTGLDATSDTIMSIACFLTDYDLNLIEPNGYEAEIHTTKDALESMSDWCITHHGASGLSERCLKSTTTALEAAQGLLAYMKKWIPAPRSALLAGNSVHADKMFLVKEPWHIVMEHLHYRILDVSAIKEAARRWALQAVLEKAPKKEGKHEARADVLESIEEARFYRDAFFKKPVGG